MGKNKIIPYDSKLKIIARNLRKRGTLGEVLLWNALKGKRLGFQFHRQVPMDKYIIDFYCHELMLALEIDGITHDSKYEVDQLRQRNLEKYGVNFIRFQEKDVRNNLEGVIEVIKSWINEKSKD